MVVWERRSIQILGSDADTIMVCLAVFCLALGIGFALLPLWTKSRFASLNRLSFVVLAIMAGTVAGQRLAPMLNFAVAGIAPLRSSGWNNVLLCALVSMVLEFIPALGLGILLANPASGTGRPPPGAKLRLWPIASFISGAAGGYLLGSLYLLPHLGTLPAVALAMSALCVVMMANLAKEGRATEGVISAAVAGVMLFSLGTGLGDAYQYGDPVAFTRAGVEFFKVAREGDVRVIRKGEERRVEVNGVPAVSSGQGQAGDWALACVPRLLRPEATNIFIGGFGSGAVLDAALLWPQSKVVCAEPEPAMIAAALVVRGTNPPPPKTGSVSLVTAQSRRALQEQNIVFDAVLLNCADPRLPGAASLLTRQFYTAAKKRLAPGGVLAQRLRVDSFLPSGLAMVARTLVASFPYCGLVRISDSEAVLVASDRPILGPVNALRTAQQLIGSVPAIGAKLDDYFGTTNLSTLLTTLLWLDEGGLRRLGRSDGEQALASDWTFCLASSMSQKIWEKEDQLLTAHLVIAAANLKTFEETTAHSGSSALNGAAAHTIGCIFAQHEFRGAALEVANWGLRLDPTQPELLADRLIWSMEDDSKVIEDTMSRIEKTSVQAARRLGSSLLVRKQYRQGRVVFERLTKLYPESAVLWADLAVICERSGDTLGAKHFLARASSLDPANEIIKGMAKE